MNRSVRDGLVLSLYSVVVFSVVALLWSVGYMGLMVGWLGSFYHWLEPFIGALAATILTGISGFLIFLGPWVVFQTVSNKIETLTLTNPLRGAAEFAIAAFCYYAPFSLMASYVVSLFTRPGDHEVLALFVLLGLVFLIIAAIWRAVVWLFPRKRSTSRYGLPVKRPA